ncbi:MAG: KpsF/GutQ family sugar-phosphate isomerase [Chloroflexi bacterium]|nr:KpsF/GutQ family sugar-phosphate isomerase [Chloroflexota bacterium]|tara:strand:+ start:33083 stop:34069 length:987 start_codon:yes stop_codon:yes gene_type:complete
MKNTQHDNILDSMHAVLQNEIDALEQVKMSLDETYVHSVETLHECHGKVVVTGIGKSGLVAQKIAATLVSTGTTAVFLDGGNAIHGDIGIILENDIVIAISKSGETEEILNLLPYIQEIGAPLVVITCNINSTLAKRATHVLYAPIEEEACALGLAPTSSTTASLAIGDALAISLMRLNGFTAERFSKLHPGGTLGRRLLLKVSDVMRSGPNNPVVTIDDSISNMLYQITTKRAGAVSVIDDNQYLVGLVTDYDIRRILENGDNILSLNISDVMNSDPTSIYSDEKAISAYNLMKNREKPFLVLSVIERRSNKVIGLIHLQDLVSKGL